MSRLAVVVALLAAAVLVGCAQPVDQPAGEGQSASPAPRAETPSQSAATSERSSEPTETRQEIATGDRQEVATPNGTAAFRIPPGWTAQLTGERVDYDGETHWVNEITLADAAGELHMRYVDGPFDDVGAVAHFGVTRATPVATLDDAERRERDDVEPGHLDHHAIAWWTSADRSTFTAHAALANSATGESPPTSIVIDGERSISLGTVETFTSEADAVAWLESDDVTLLLEIVATLDLTAIPAPALP